MKVYVLLSLLLIGALAQKQLSLPVEPQTQKKLSSALKSLSEQLQTFRTPKQNPNSLYTKVNDAAVFIQEVRRQLGQTNNLVIGQGNYVKGSRNILIGNYDTIRGSNNFVFVENFDGTVNGALLIEKWKIILNKRQSIKTNPSFAIFYINQEENRKYERYLTKNRGFYYGSNLNKNTVLLVQDDNDQMEKQIHASLAALQRPNLASLFGPSTAARNSPQNGFQFFGSPNTIEQPQQYETAKVRPNNPALSQPANLQRQNQQTYQGVNQMAKQTSINDFSAYPTKFSLNSFPPGSINQIQIKPVQVVRKKESAVSATSNPKVIQSSLSGYENKETLSGNQGKIANADPNTLLNNLRAEEAASREMFNVLNAQMRRSLNSRYVRAQRTYQPQPAYSQTLSSGQNYVFQNMGPLYGQYRGYN